MRGTFVKTLMEMMWKDKSIIVVTADMGYGTFEGLRDKFPDRFINAGVSEANAAGISAGLAMNGYTVFFYAQAAFVTLRCFEQVRLDIASNNLNVKLVGTSSGFTLSQYGVSHFALEDVAAMRSLPNMTVLCPGDLYEAEQVTKLACSFKGPAYIRIGRTNSGPDEFIHLKKPKLRIGEPIFIKRGNMATIISTGSMLFLARELADELKNKKIDAALISLPTVKPLNVRKVLNLFKNKKIVYVLEEHSMIGGLGSAISELVADRGLSYRVVRMGTADKFLHVTGSREYLIGLCGLTAKKIAARIERDLKQKP
ncbi:MAG: transketolase C-terminal domain-containing protein [Patescibacteria group bacterium]